MSYGNRDYPRFREVGRHAHQQAPAPEPQQGGNGGGEFEFAAYLRLSRTGNGLTFRLNGRSYTFSRQSLQEVLDGKAEYCVISRYSNGGGGQ